MGFDIFTGRLFTGGSSGGGTAADTTYDNSDSPLLSTDVKSALDELSWKSVNVTFADSPVSMVPQVIYHVDTSAGIVQMVLPDVTADNDNQHYRIYKVKDSNDCIVSTVGGTQLIGGDTQQVIVQTNTGFSVQANFDLSKYEITQNSRTGTIFSTIFMYALTDSSDDVPAYSAFANSTTDPRYGAAVDVSIGPVTGTANLIGTWITEAGRVQGTVPETTMGTLGKVRRIAGTGTAQFYVEYYKRDSGGTETLIATSSKTGNIDTATYEEITVTGVASETTFAETDYIVAKFYVDRTGGGNDPTYEFQIEGDGGGRTAYNVPSGAISHGSMEGVNAAGTGIGDGHVDNSKPLQFPELTTTEMNAVVSPVNGMKIFNTTTGTYYEYIGGAWTEAGGGGKLIAVDGGYSVDNGAPRGIIGLEAINFGVGLNSTAYGALGDYSFCAGFWPKATGTNSVAIGYSCTASGLNSVALGRGTASDEYAIAIGKSVVASNDEAISMGGDSGTASGEGSVQIGAGNTASGAHSFVFGVSSSVVNVGAFAFGYYQSVSGDYATCIGGYGNDATENYSLASGVYSQATHWGERSHSSGRYASDGDCQIGYVIKRASSSTTSQTELFLDGTTRRLTLADGDCYSCEIVVMGKQTDGSCGTAKYIALIKNEGGTVSLTGALQTILAWFGDTNIGAPTWAVEADDTNDALVVKVTPANTTATRWSAKINYSKINY